MNQHHPNIRTPAGLVGAICGSLLITVPASAVPVSQVNPCPGIYYEQPYNLSRVAPQGCPPNGAVQQPGVQRLTPNLSITPANNLTPPLPEERSQPISWVLPIGGKVNVLLKNNTNTPIAYQAIGYTSRRFLPAGEQVILRNLPAPVTLSSVRVDKGLLEVTPKATTLPGLLEVKLDESNQLSDDLGVLRIQKNGQVFLN